MSRTLHHGQDSARGSSPLSLLPTPDHARELARQAQALPSLDLTPRQTCDLELLLTGGFAPLRGFQAKADVDRVVGEMRLVDGTLWPIPITLDVPADRAAALARAPAIALRDVEGLVLAILDVEEVTTPDRATEAAQVYGTRSTHHPGVAELLRAPDVRRFAGALRGIALPVHYDFAGLRHTPAALRAEFARRGWTRIVAFQTRNPMHRAHVELTRRAAEQTGAHLLLHPVVGLTRPDDVDHFTRVQTYQKVLPRYPQGLAMLSLLPLAMRMAGPREALWHAIIRRNHGCTHFIVGRDHAGPGNDEHGRPFYGPYDAQRLLAQHEAEIGIQSVPFAEMVFVEETQRFVPIGEVPAGATTRSLSGTEVRRHLERGSELPEWFTYPEVAQELRRRHPPRQQQGVVVLFTGLSGAGKSTIARAVQIRLLEAGERRVTLLDGDHVRKMLSSELGFSREHRDLNVLRIGFVGTEVARHGGIALCAPIAPYDSVRKQIRAMAQGVGGFALVHVATPIEVCEQRDRKGLYAKARAGQLANFTGVSDPYEAPADAELVIDAATCTPAEAAERILGWLQQQGFLAGAGRP
jgi:sulfate adenylyltransferase